MIFCSHSLLFFLVGSIVRWRCMLQVPVWSKKRWRMLEGKLWTLLLSFWWWLIDSPILYPPSMLPFGCYFYFPLPTCQFISLPVAEHCTNPQSKHLRITLLRHSLCRWCRMQTEVDYLDCCFYFRNNLFKNICGISVFVWILHPVVNGFIHWVMRICQGGVQSWLLIGVNDSKSSICVPQTSSAD